MSWKYNKRSKTWVKPKKGGGFTHSKKKPIAASRTKASSSTKKKKGGSKSMAGKKKSRGGSARRIIGNLGLKGLISGALVLSGMKYVVRRFAPQAGAYTTALSSVGTGVVGHVVGLPTKSLAQFGAVDGISELIYDLISPGGLVTFPSIGEIGAPPGFDV